MLSYLALVTGAILGSSFRYFFTLLNFTILGLPSATILVNIIGSLFYGTILGIFLVAIFIKSVKSKAIFISAIISELIILFIFYNDWVSFLWLNFIGGILTVANSLIIQKITKK